MKFRAWLLAPLAVAAMMFNTGCANKAAAERDSLLKQNKDLTAQLEQEKAAREAADDRANAAAAAAATPATQPATPSMEAATPDTGTIGTADMGTVGNLGGGVYRGHNAQGEDTITVASDILFASGKAALKPSAKKALDRAAGILKKEYAGRELRIEGYTDPNPVKHSAWDDNWDLGAARARAVMLYLHGKGIRNMYIASFGATKLKSSKNYAQDRRVEIVVVRNAK